MAALLNPGDEALIPAPAFLSYGSCVHMASGVPVFVPTEQAKGFQPEPDVLERHITPKTKLILINSPQNPTGTVYPRETLQGIADLAIRHDLIVVSDEINEKIIFDGEEHISIASLPGMRERTVVLNGFSQSLCHDRLAHRVRGGSGTAHSPHLLRASVFRHVPLHLCAVGGRRRFARPAGTHCGYGKRTGSQAAHAARPGWPPCPAFPSCAPRERFTSW